MKNLNIIQIENSLRISSENEEMISKIEKNEELISSKYPKTIIEKMVCFQLPVEEIEKKYSSKNLLSRKGLKDLKEKTAEIDTVKNEAVNFIVNLLLHENTNL